jgi:uncharacterized protein YjbJ (UPF0337 family)
MAIGRIDMSKLRGVADKALGLGKEFAGVLINNDHLQQEGEAQQERATANLRSLRKELEAQKEETKARAAERKEKIAQRAKES